MVNNILGLDMKVGWNFLNMWKTSESGWNQRKRWSPRYFLRRIGNVIDRKGRDISSGAVERGLKHGI